MLKERLQILITAEQRRTLEAEAARRGASVGALVREAIDARFDTVDRSRRRAAFDRLTQIAARSEAPQLDPEALDELLDGTRADALPRG